ncbi:MAG: hypothetical protein AAGC46_10675 [Solirubrobacteraceae bacterium]|nr:hypothetical protein [Patulibacter sp.]
MAQRVLLAGGLLALTGVIVGATGCGDDGLEVRGRAPISSAADVAQIVGCDGRGQRAPARLDLHCHAPRLSLTDLRWRDWAAPVAIATGRLVSGDGDTPATVRASQLVLGTRTGQYRALAVTAGSGAARRTTAVDIDDRGPIDQ